MAILQSTNKCFFFQYAQIGKAVLFELAFCNPWEFFFTGTLDKNKYNREDLDKFHKDFTRFIRLYNKKYNLNNISQSYIELFEKLKEEK